MTDLNADHEGVAPTFSMAPDNASIIASMLPIPSEEEISVITNKSRHKRIRLKRLPLIPQFISKLGNRKKEKAVPLYKLFRFATPIDWFFIVCAFICSAGTGAIQPVSIIFMGDLMGDLADNLSQPSQLLDACRPVILIFVYIGTATMVASYISNCFWILAGENQAQRIKREYMHSIMHQEMAWFDKADDGSLVTRLSSDIQLIQDGISEKCGLFIVCIVQFITGFVVAFVEGWNLAVIMLVTIPVMGITGALMGYYITKYTLKSQDEYANAGSIAEQVFSGIRTVYSFSLQDRFGTLYEEKLEKALKAGIKRGTVLGMGFGAFIFILFSTYGLTFWYGGRLIRRGEIDGPTVMVVFYSMMIGAMSLLMLPPNLSAVSSACGAAYKIFSTIDRVPEISKFNGPQKVLDNLRGEIEFRHVRFKYPTRPDLVILKDLCLTVKPGQTVAFVGASGSGKSTSVQLLQRFYDPVDGQILLDGVDIKELNLAWLRQQLGIVSQEPVLFNMSIRQNLLLGVKDGQAVTEEDIVRACTEANCHSFISKMPEGYDTLVGEQGGMLSGGQKQRIAIARAIIKNPSILLLDEATSALDTQSERLVQKALDTASAKRTTIVIAHRLSTIRNADLIVVMNHGQLVERGTHQELIQLGGIYAELVKKQEIALQQKAAQQDDDAIVDPEKQGMKEPDEDEALLQKLHPTNAVVANKKDTMVMMTEHAGDGDEKKRFSTAGSSTASAATKVNAHRLDAYEIKIQREKQAKKDVKKRSAPVKRVLLEMRPELPRLILGCIGAAIAGAIFPVYSLLFAKVIVIITVPNHPDMQDTGAMKGINLYAFLFVIIGIAGFCGFAMQAVSFEVAGEYYTRRLRAAVFRNYMKQEVGFFDEDENHAGALTSRLAVDAKNVNEMVTKVWGDVIQVIVTCIVGLVIAFVYSWTLTLIILCMVPFILGATSYEARVHRGYEDGTKRANAQSGEVAGEAIKEIRTVTALDRQQFFEDRYTKANERPHKMAVRRAYLSSIGFALLRGIMLYTSAVAFYAGIRLIMDGWIDFLDMFTCMMSIMITAQTAGHGSVFTSTFSKAKIAAIAIFDIMDRKPEIDPELEGIEPPVGTLEGEVEFRDVAFSYPSRPENPIFTGQFNLHGEKNMTIALVGPSGCGKSTTIGMLQRWYDPFGGRVSLDDHDLQSFTLRNLRSHMALVSQEPVLFDMSIGDNVRFGIDNRYNTVKHEGGDDYLVSQEEVEDACRQANIHEFIASLPDGYNTRVGDKGSQLSGGQKQRIAIARALIRKPRLLLLDEATSALDSDSEKVVQQALDKIIEQGGRTTITIAHRLSTIQNADLICVVKDGVVAEQGTHWELLALNGIYNSLVHEQSLQV